MSLPVIWWYRQRGGVVAKSYSAPAWRYEAPAVDRAGAEASLLAWMAGQKFRHYEPLEVPERRAA